jgi:hypothetical protein
MNQITQTTALVAALAASAGAMAQDDIHPSLNSKFWAWAGALARAATAWRLAT